MFPSSKMNRGENKEKECNTHYKLTTCLMSRFGVDFISAISFLFWKQLNGSYGLKYIIKTSFEVPNHPKQGSSVQSYSIFEIYIKFRVRLVFQRFPYGKNEELYFLATFHLFPESFTYVSFFKNE